MQRSREHLPEAAAVEMGSDMRAGDSMPTGSDVR